jgi:hypothetical protein
MKPTQGKNDIFGGFIDHVKDHALVIYNLIIFLILHSYSFSSELIGVC